MHTSLENRPKLKQGIACAGLVLLLLIAYAVGIVQGWILRHTDEEMTVQQEEYDPMESYDPFRPSFTGDPTGSYEPVDPAYLDIVSIDVTRHADGSLWVDGLVPYWNYSHTSKNYVRNIGAVIRPLSIDMDGHATVIIAPENDCVVHLDFTPEDAEDSRAALKTVSVGAATNDGNCTGGVEEGVLGVEWVKEEGP